MIGLPHEPVVPTQLVGVFGRPNLILDDHRPLPDLVEQEEVYPAIARVDFRLDCRLIQTLFIGVV
jgi:hypothetical protein